jgi:Ca2+/H+ antiporter, TMEM165/GDT1 family
VVDVTELVLAFGLVFVAELGDKSMLLALAFATRFRPWPVFGGIVIAAAVSTGLATLVGAALGAALPERELAIGAGLLFLGFGWWALRDVDDDEDTTADLRGRSVLVGVTLAFLLAELGDKTTLATAALASTQSALPTWIGATLGMSASSGLAIVVGSRLAERLSPRVTRRIAAGAFAVFGVLLLVEGVRG